MTSWIDRRGAQGAKPACFAAFAIFVLFVTSCSSGSGYRHSCRGYRRESSGFIFGYTSRQKFVRSSVT